MYIDAHQRIIDTLRAYREDGFELCWNDETQLAGLSDADLASLADALLAAVRPEPPKNEQGEELFCPRCGAPDSEGYTRAVLDG